MKNNVNLDMNTNSFVTQRLFQLRKEPLDFSCDNKKSDISFKKIQETDSFLSKNSRLALKMLSPIPQVRKLSSIPDNIEQGNWQRALGLFAFMAVYIPEDTRDLKDGINHIINKITGKATKSTEYYKNYQVPFAFLKGTLLEPLLTLKGSIGDKISGFFTDIDKSLYDTSIGKFLQKTFNFKRGEIISTGRIYGDNIEVFAREIKGNWLSKIAQRSLMRITTLGVVTLALLELPAIVKAFTKKEETKEKIVNVPKQLLKSGIYITTMASSIGVVGAVMAATALGPAGSLLGMGIGAIIGGKIIASINKVIDKNIK